MVVPHSCHPTYAPSASPATTSATPTRVSHVARDEVGTRRVFHASAARRRTGRLRAVPATLVAKDLSGGHGHRVLFEGLDLTVAPAT